MGAAGRTPYYQKLQLSYLQPAQYAHADVGGQNFTIDEALYEQEQICSLSYARNPPPGYPHITLPGHLFFFNLFCFTKTKQNKTTGKIKNY